METKRDHKYIIQEVAILFESGFYKYFEKKIVVSCLEETAIMRVMKRDSVSELEVKDRLQNQWTEQKKIQLADYIIQNNNSSLIISQVLSIHNKLIK